MTPILTTLAPGLLEAGSRLIMVSSGRSPIRKGANLRNYSGRRVIIVRTLVGNPCIRKPFRQLEIKVKIEYST